MNILGLNAYHGDSSAAMLTDGKLTAAVEEERLNRIKHWAGLPVGAASYCIASCDQPAVEHIAVSRNPRANFRRKVIRVALRSSLWGQAAGRGVNSTRVLRIKRDLIASGLGELRHAKMHFVEHHRAHLASAFFASPFERAAVLSVDGFGDFSSSKWGTGCANNLRICGSVSFPHSLGLFYTAFTQFLGFPNYGDEYKMMGLSAYGEPRYLQQVRNIVRREGDQIVLNLEYFRHHSEGVEMSWCSGQPRLGNVFSTRFLETFGGAREPRTEIRQCHMDLAASVQKVLEEIYLGLLRHVRKKTGEKAVCLAGGVALNCVANGMIFARTDFEDVYVQPAAHDAGTSLGAALYVWHEKLGKPRSFVMQDVYYGAAYDESSIRRALEARGVVFHSLTEEELLTRTAQEIAKGRILGWYQGRMEFGPRALGNRSILADPRRKEMKDVLNSRIKYREPFRPFCPSVLLERVGEYFNIEYPSPFMVMAYEIKPEQRERIPAVTHGDGTGRLQTVDKAVNPLYWKLIREFEKLTGVAVLLNTSFNENEPIVDTPAQAIDCFLRTQMDVLVIGGNLLLKTENLDVAVQGQFDRQILRV